MQHTPHAFVAASLFVALVLSSALQPAHSQTAPLAETKPADPMLALKAALVLTPGFCASKTNQGSFWTNGKTKLSIGKDACAEFEPLIRGAFSSLTRIADASAAGDAQVVLVPRLVDANKKESWGGDEVVVFLEWTLKDRSGKTIWLETVQGHAKDIIGKKNQDGELVYGDFMMVMSQTVKDAVRDLARQSASKMAASPELRKLAQQSAPQTEPEAPTQAPQ
jgi:hypothetical protein